MKYINENIKLEGQRAPIADEIVLYINNEIILEKPTRKQNTLRFEALPGTGESKLNQAIERAFKRRPIRVAPRANPAPHRRHQHGAFFSKVQKGSTILNVNTNMRWKISIYNFFLTFIVA